MNINEGLDQIESLLQALINRENHNKRKEEERQRLNNSEETTEQE